MERQRQTLVEVERYVHVWECERRNEIAEETILPTVHSKQHPDWSSHSSTDQTTPCEQEGEWHFKVIANNHHILVESLGELACFVGDQPFCMKLLEIPSNPCGVELIITRFHTPGDQTFCQ